MTFYSTTRSRRGLMARAVLGVDDVMNWFLYGYETWLVALIKGVPLFLYMYFLLFYVPNYVYYGITLYLLQFSKDVGFLVANIVGGTNFVVLIILALWTQAARGRSGFFWSLIRYLDFLQFVGVMLLLIPLLVFNLAGGTFVPTTPAQVANPFPFWAVALGTITAAIDAAALVYLYFEYRRITQREAREAATAAAGLRSGA
jgi:hypothetical protein